MQAFFLAPAMLAQARDAEAAGILTAVCCCYGTPILLSLVLNILMIAGQWAAFDKAGQPGWAAIIPIYNLIVWAESFIDSTSLTQQAVLRVQVDQAKLE